jgi:hypothetical protein
VLGSASGRTCRTEIGEGAPGSPERVEGCVRGWTRLEEGDTPIWILREPPRRDTAARSCPDDHPVLGHGRAQLPARGVSVGSPARWLASL